MACASRVGVAIRDASVDDAVFEVADRVGDADLPVAGEHRRERLVGGRELDDGEVLAVLGEPEQRGPDAELDAADRVGLVADRLLLALAQVVVRRLEQLGEQLLLRGEVPVEDAFADAQRGDDVGHRGRVIAPLREESRPAFHELVAALTASRGQLAPHPGERSAALDRPVNNRLPSSHRQLLFASP